MRILIIISMMVFSATVFAGNATGKLEIGDKAVLTDAKMIDVSGESISIDDVKKKNGVLVLFSCNTCPFVMRWEGRYSDIKKWADKNEVGMIVLNSNYQKRSGDDSLEAMKQHAKEKHYNFYYVVDKESRVANAFRGQTTPHAFLFDGNLNLAYKGAIDDSYESADEVSQHYLKDAITSLGKGKKVAVAQTKPVGCSIKRKVE
ncbi:MAG: thioredoxin family protein [Bacteroidota bacterium]